MKIIYYAEIAFNVHDNVSYDMLESKSFDTEEEVVQWAKSHWNGPIEVRAYDDSYVGEIARSWRDTEDEGYDLLVVCRNKRLS